MSPGHRLDEETSATPTEATRHVIYVSSARAPGARDAFASICAQARERNPARGIGGVLLYDGHFFAHWLHGPEAAVQAMMQRITADLRHEGLCVRMDVVLPLRETARPWRAGYTGPDVLPAFMLRLADAEADVLAEFLRLLPEADLWPPLDPPPNSPSSPPPNRPPSPPPNPQTPGAPPTTPGASSG
jgi:hypothetical protein